MSERQRGAHFIPPLGLDDTILVRHDARRTEGGKDGLQRQHVVLYVALRDPDLQGLIHPATSGMDDVAQAIAGLQPDTLSKVVETAEHEIVA